MLASLLQSPSTDDTTLAVACWEPQKNPGNLNMSATMWDGGAGAWGWMVLLGLRESHLDGPNQRIMVGFGWIIGWFGGWSRNQQ